MGFIGRQPTPVPLTSSDITDGIVTTAKIADTAVSTAKIADDAVGNTKLDLTANYAFTGTITGAGGVNTPSFCVTRAGSNQTVTASTWTICEFNSEIYDEGGCYNNTGSTVTLNGISTPQYAFAPNVAGKCYVFFNFMPNVATTHAYAGFYLNGSGYYPIQTDDGSQGGGCFIGTILNLNGSGNYVQAVTYQGTGTGQLSSATQYNIFGAYRILGA